MSKKLNYGYKAKKKLFNGIEKLEKMVGATLGPRGRFILLETNYEKPRPTKDGITVAKEVNLEDPIENLGVKIIREASDETNTNAGDGTTTSIVLAKELIKVGLRLMDMGIDPSDIKRVFQKASADLLLWLEGKAIEPTPELLKNIVKISSNSDEQVYELVTEAYELATLDGVIGVEDSPYGYSLVEKVNGYHFERGISSPSLFPDKGMLKVEVENPLVVIYDDKVRNSEEILPILKRLATEHPGRPVVFIADEFNPQALHILTVNNKSRGFEFYAVKSPSFGENRDYMLEDIAVMTNAIVISADRGMLLQQATPEFAGSADKIVIGLRETSIIGGHGDSEEIKDRIDFLKSQITPTTPKWEQDQIKARIARLTGGAAKIKVFAPTESELKEIKDRIDDALHAYRAAATSGILPGGGIALLKYAREKSKEAIKEINENDEKIIMSFFLQSLEAPFNRIIKNAGKIPGNIIKEIPQDFNMGYNAKDFKVEDLIKAGIVDSLKVVSQAVTNSVSAANVILMSEGTITNIPGTEVDLSTPPQLPLE